MYPFPRSEERPQPTFEAKVAAQRLVDAWLSPGKRKLIEKFPMARTEEEFATLRAQEEAPRSHWTDGLPEDHPYVRGMISARRKNPAMRACMDGTSLAEAARLIEQEEAR